MKAMETKLASCGSAQDLKISMSEFWCCKPSDIVLNDDGTVAKTSGRVMSVKWWNKGKRFFFGY